VCVTARCREVSAMLRLTAIACLLACAHALTTEERDARKKAVRMKTTRQLKEIFDELSIPVGIAQRRRPPVAIAR
jgi:hypothetical protein